MSKTKLGHRGRRRGQAVLLTRAAIFGLGTLVALPLGVSAQSQPPPLSVYSDDFSASDNTAAPGTVQHGTQIAVEVEDLDDLETRTTALEERMQAHLDDAGAHQPHGHPHSHGGGPAAVYSANTRHDHSRFDELLAQAIAFLAPAAHAQQPPPLVVYTPDMSGPSSTAPLTTGTQLTATLDVGVPMLAQLDALLVQLNSQLTATSGIQTPIRTAIRTATEAGSTTMGTTKHPARLAAAMAIILGSAASSPDAEAQSSLNVYSDEFTGGSRPAPTGASRDTVINMNIPRLHALHRQLVAVQSTLRNHPMPAHGHPPHSHPEPEPPVDDDDTTDDDGAPDDDGATTDGTGQGPPGGGGGPAPGSAGPSGGGEGSIGTTGGDLSSAGTDAGTN